MGGWAMSRVRSDYGLTFDDVLLAPRHSKVHPSNVSLVGRLTANISLNLPLLSG
jgi:IMP dehydrogenase